MKTTVTPPSPRLLALQATSKANEAAIMARIHAATVQARAELAALTPLEKLLRSWARERIK